MSAIPKASKKQVQKAESHYEACRKRAVDDVLWAGVGVARDLLSEFAAFQTYAAGGTSIHISFSCPVMPSWTPELESAIFDLTKSNMRALYDAAGPHWKWNDSKKRGELYSEVNRCLVARDAAGALLGFLNFRLLLEGHYEILYVYELQVAESAQRKGIGQRLMQLAELIARKNGLQWWVRACYPHPVARSCAYL